MSLNHSIPLPSGLLRGVVLHAVLAAATASFAQAQLLFHSRNISLTASGVQSAFAADVDGDGDTDVLAAATGDNMIVWYENMGGNPPAFAERIIAAVAASSVFAADVDGDGNIDVLSASYADDRIAWYKSDGLTPPAFTEQTISTSADGARCVFAADVDGDGDIDVLSASHLDDTIAWYENTGGSPPSFTKRTISISADSASSVFAADVDGDGNIDVLSASVNDDTIAWYQNMGGNPPTFTDRTISTTANGPWSVFAADVDGDGDTDALSASANDSTIAWYENTGGNPPSFTKRTISNIAYGALSVFATDVDDDGDTDVLSASSSDDTIAWYESDGLMPPNFTKRTITTEADYALSVIAVDVDSDGDTDVLSASANDDTIAWYENTGQTQPTYTERTISTTADYARSVFAADVDGDGDTDALSASSSDDTIAWYENDGLTPPSFTERIISTQADNARSVFAADVDGDGATDVLSASHTDDTIAWYESDGLTPPSFTERIISTSADGARSVFAADVDGDGDTDVLSASCYDDTIAWYENTGGNPPAFTERIISTAADCAQSVFAADVDGDGDTDVLSASTNDDTIAWYESDGLTPPGFTRRVISTAADKARSVFAADVDGDGDIDVLSASHRDAKIAWYENDGLTPAGFTERIITTVADVAQSVYAADVDGDGDTDVLSASADDDKIAWYKNTGGSPPDFTVLIISTTADGAQSVFAADVDGDGDTDVLSASGDDKIAWYEIDFHTVVCVGDVDGDNDTDTFDFTVFAPNYGSSGLTPFTNGDLDGDGDIDAFDFVVFALDFGCSP